MVVFVVLTKAAEKQLLKAPPEIQEKVWTWLVDVQEKGLQTVRLQRGLGLHDEPLKGSLTGMRSIRLNRSWRLYYVENQAGEVIVTVVRIDKHVY